MPHNPHLAELMRAAVKGRPGFSEKKMFGRYCWMLNGNMLCGVEVGRYIFRVGKDLEAQALAKPGVTIFDLTKRPMRGFVWADADAAIDAGLDHGLDLATHYVGSLPPQ